MVENKTALISIAVLLLGAVMFSGNLSFATGEFPKFDDCTVTDSGDLQQCTFASNDADEISDTTGEKTVPFNVDMYVNGPGHEHLNTVIPFLYKNGFKTSDVQSLDEARQQDVNLSQEVRTSLEQNSQCTVDISFITSDGNTYLYDGSTMYSLGDDDDSDPQLKITEVLDGTTETVVSESVTVTEQGGIVCSFEYSSVLLDNIDLNEVEQFSLDGDYESPDGTINTIGFSDTHEIPGATLDVDLGIGIDPVVEGGGSTGQDSDLNGVDSDGDGVLDRNDAAPNTPGSLSDGSPGVLEKIVHLIPGFSDWLYTGF